MADPLPPLHLPHRQKGVSVKGSGYGGKSQTLDLSLDFLMPREYPAGTPTDAQYPNLPPFVFLACAGWVPPPAPPQPAPCPTQLQPHPLLRCVVLCAVLAQ